MIMQLIQRLQSTCDTPSGNSVCMTIQVECITFHLDDPVKLQFVVTAGKPCQHIYP